MGILRIVIPNYTSWKQLQPATKDYKIFHCAISKSYSCVGLVKVLKITMSVTSQHF